MPPLKATMRKTLFLLLMIAVPAFAADVTFEVIGMDCEGCAKPAIGAIKDAGGKNVRLDWKKGVATVDVPDGFDLKRIRTALNNAGFEAKFPGEKTTGLNPLPAAVIKSLDVNVHPGTSKVVIAKILAPGKVTVVDFYGDWCGPCKVLENRLYHLMQGKPALALRRIDIGKWDNAAAKQATREFRAKALPYIRVYDAKGKFVAAVTGGMWDEVLEAIGKAEAR